MLPQEAVDAIVVHELSHIVYKNHDKDFYGLVQKYIPNYKEIDKWLNLCINELGVKYLIADIEEKWFVRKNGEVPENVKDLLRYIRSRCERDNIEFEFFDRALVLNL